MTAEFRTAKDYVEFLARADAEHNQFYVWVLAHGRAFEPKPLAPDEKRFIAECKRRRRNVKRACFSNAQTLTEYSMGKLEYYEGWAISELPIPVDHGWNALDGKVVDVTWAYAQSYFGVPIPLSFIRQMWLKTRYASAILADWALNEGFVQLKEAIAK